MEKDIYYLKNRAHKVGHAVRNSMGRLSQQAQDAVQNSLEGVGERASHYMLEGEVMVSRANRRLKRSIHQHPYRAVLASAGLGCLLGALIPTLMKRAWRQ